MFMELEEMKPCPMCGSKKISISSLYRLAFTDIIDSDTAQRLNRTFVTRCEGPTGSGIGCGSKSPPFNKESDAIDYWNAEILTDNITIEDIQNGKL